MVRHKLCTSWHKLNTEVTIFMEDSNWQQLQTSQSALFQLHGEVLFLSSMLFISKDCRIRSSAGKFGAKPMLRNRRNSSGNPVSSMLLSPKRCKQDQTSLFAEMEYSKLLGICSWSAATAQQWSPVEKAPRLLSQNKLILTLPDGNSCDFCNRV